MPFQEDFEEFLDVEQGFAVEARITPASGTPYLIRGILVNDYLDIDAGMAGVAGCSPAFECAEEEAENIEYGDFLTVKKTNYRVTAIKPDGTGWLVLELERQS